MTFFMVLFSKSKVETNESSRRNTVGRGNTHVKHKKINGHLNIKFMVDNSGNI